MPSKPQILPSRRTYNKWVANETLEDFALRFTAKRARRWSISRIAHTALGTASFLVLEALGGGITLAYGFTNSFYAIMVVCSLLFLTGLPIAYYSAKHGVDIDLLTRGAGFGYIGSTISSLIYASFTFIFFALEAAIMSMALHLLIGIPLPIAYILSSIIIIPLVTHGIAMISRFQIWTQPLWVVLQLLPFIYIAQHSSVNINDWINFGGISNPEGQEFNILLFGAAAAILFPLVAQIGEQVDFLRFLPQKETATRFSWWTALVVSGPGWVFLGVLKLLAGSFLAYLALKYGVEAGFASDPTHMYQVAFSFVTQSPQIALLLAGVFVIVCQLKINVANAYAGSLAWSNFFSRLTHHHPGRVVWVVFNVAIALILMELGIYEALETVLQTYSALVLAWIGSIVADLIINKPLGLSPKHIEFKRSHLYDINPVGVGSMMIASSIGIISHFGVMGELAQALSPFIALFLPFATVPLIAFITKGKYYLARTDSADPAATECAICQNSFDTEDMTSCPAYKASICSLCCSLDSQCGDQCRPQATLASQIKQSLKGYIPETVLSNLNSTLGHFVTTLTPITLVLFSLLALIYAQTPYENIADRAATGETLTKVFFLLLILLGVVTWLYVLSQQSRRDALQESQQQTQLLLKEMAAHEKTYNHLQEAKESAENANQAKSRYLTGISHELRTPLNVVLGYAQLLEQSQDIPIKHRDSLNLIRQNGEHLTDLIEGLLEISKIEAGRLELQRDEIRLPALLDQLAGMFRLQAQNKRLEFNYSRSTHLPEYISIDVKRLRQILMNLLSNAIKYTSTGSVSFNISYSHQVVKFVIQDSGVGIGEEDQQRIFDPFERVRTKSTQQVSGSGLGLAITYLLADLMGGEVSVESTLGKGSTFTLKMALSSIDKQAGLDVATYQNITAYAGEQKTILITDDEYLHRRLISEFLSPLGFNLLEADCAESCLTLMNEGCHVDLFLLDVSMPDMDGWQLSKALRQQGFAQPIVMISANSRENNPHNTQKLHQAYLAKPIQLDHLLEKIGEILALDWIYNEQITESETLIKTEDNAHTALNQQTLKELRALAEIGFLTALKDKVARIEEDGAMNPELLRTLNTQITSCNFPAVVDTLDEFIQHD